ncbi:hypothetical protein QBC35DRAFT_422155 [Podospora australis]|uniref:Uncharacterized protein n=1 Tax=Podospora australis TaxID=1536484 RepID=A0AAN6X6L6_9PEZI|nr:hypothetical protein QBC35DRAFT_422155 [Podospora australis]
MAMLSRPYTLIPSITGKDIDSSIKNAVDSHFLEISAIRQAHIDATGSVLAVVTFPKDSGSSPACDGKKWQDTYIRMDYDKLRGLGSSKINDMFKPRAQQRFRRNLNMSSLPEGVEYVLDFTPPREGPELADLTAALWLPKMVKYWFLAGQYLPDRCLANGPESDARPLADKAVGSIMTLGHDDACRKPNCLWVDVADWRVSEGVPGIVPDDGVNPNHIPAFRNVEDYCPIRHRVAIIRVLRAIKGHGLHLNSAVRMWTVAQVAIYLEVPNVVVDYVTQWLVAAPNTKFVEICPEKAFQLAYALRIPMVLTAAFQILVNEAAIDYAAQVRSPRRSRFTWVGRERDDYGDFPSDPVEYASRAFLERMESQLSILQSDRVFDHLPKIWEWERMQRIGWCIRKLEPCQLQEKYDQLVRALAATFHRELASILMNRDGEKTHFDYNNILESQRKHYVRNPALKMDTTYAFLDPAQKILTPFFWRSLREVNGAFHQYHGIATSQHGGVQVQKHVMDFNSRVREAVDDGRLDPAKWISPTKWLIGDDAQPRVTFDLRKFLSELFSSVREFSNNVADRKNDRSFPFFLSDHHLLTLDDNELKYLPIWADGLDDGSGGVYQDVIPPTDMGPSEPGPAYHTGWTAAGTDVDDADTVRYPVSTIGESDLGIDGLDIDDATIARSVSVQDTATSSNGAGRAKDLNPKRVVALPSVPSIAESSDFTTSDDGEFALAKFELPADHQAQGAALASYVEEGSSSAASSVVGVSSNTVNANGGDDDDLMEFSDDDGTSTLDGFEDFDEDLDINSDR